MIILKSKHEQLIAIERAKVEESRLFIRHLYELSQEWRDKKIGNFRAISEIYQLLSRHFIDSGSTR